MTCPQCGSLLSRPGARPCPSCGCIVHWNRPQDTVDALGGTANLRPLAGLLQARREHVVHHVSQ